MHCRSQAKFKVARRSIRFLGIAHLFVRLLVEHVCACRTARAPPPFQSSPPAVICRRRGRLIHRPTGRWAHAAPGAMALGASNTRNLCRVDGRARGRWLTRIVGRVLGLPSSCERWVGGRQGPSTDGTFRPHLCPALAGVSPVSPAAWRVCSRKTTYRIVSPSRLLPS